MPFKIDERNGKYCVVNADTDEVKGEHATIEKAKAQLRALYVDAPDAKHLDLTYASVFGIELPDLAVKSVGQDEIQGYMAIWGNESQLDIDREFFTPATDFWDASLGKSKPLTWEHAQDKSMYAPVVVGQINEMGDDNLGRWYTATLNRAHKYRRMIDQLIRSGALGTSSDSAPQYVQREQRGKATWLKTWPLFAATLTASPCEPRMIGTVDWYKSIGVDLPEMADEAKIESPRYDPERERMRFQIAKIRLLTGV